MHSARRRRGPHPRGPRRRPAQRVRPACAALAAQLGLSWCGACGGAARRAGDGAAPVRGKRLRGSGSPAREQRTGAWHRRVVGTAARSARRRSGRGAVGEVVGTAARSAGRRSGRGGTECGAAVGQRRVRGTARSARRQLSGCATRCPDIGFKPRCRRDAWLSSN
jgi:hypothetical protein